MKPISVIPNTITSLRILGTVILLFIEPFSLPFFVIYTLCGITDILDGMFARLLKCKSELGARLDSIADMMFYAVMIFKILPELISLLPVFVWIMIALTVLIRIISYSTAAIKYKRFASLHTYMNKAAGLAVFIVPYFVNLPPALFICIAVTLIAMTATIEEFIIHVTQKDYRKDVKSILHLATKETIK